jgi:hypothetical protein
MVGLIARFTHKLDIETAIRADTRAIHVMLNEEVDTETC